MQNLIRKLKKGILLILNVLCPSCPLRVRIFRLFGGNIAKNAKIEYVHLLNYDGNNLNNFIVADRAYIGCASILDLSGRIIIGKSVKMAAGCNISTHIDVGKENSLSKYFPKLVQDVVIGNNTWIGLSTTILCGVNVGENTAIGSCSLINKDIPSNVLAYGIPVKIKRVLE